jgi:multidrug efflux pump subunit AcrA (membrane-fusion protein)
VEITVPNGDLRLKPGMFIRAQVEVQRVEEARIVPIESIVTRSDVQGLFILAADGEHARWQPVTLGIRDEDRVQVSGEGLEGEVITLGQQLLEDGSAVAVSKMTAGDAVR